MSPRNVLDSAKFLALPVNAKSRKDTLASYELELLEELLAYHMNGEEYEDRIEIDGIVYRKAAFILVNKGLAAYVKDYIYPSEGFSKTFVPLFEETSAESTHVRLCSAYQAFLAARRA